MKRRGKPKPTAEVAWGIWKKFKDGHWGWMLGMGGVPELWGSDVGAKKFLRYFRLRKCRRVIRVRVVPVPRRKPR